MGTLQFFRERLVFLRTPRRSTDAVRQVHEHQMLREQLARARSAVGEVAGAAGQGYGVGASRRSCLHEITDLEVAVVRHFRGEEQDGPLASVSWVAPRYFDRARALQAQHADLEREVAAIRELAEICGRSRERWSELQWRLAAFARRLRAHERAESEVAAQVLYEDIGTKD